MAQFLPPAARPIAAALLVLAAPAALGAQVVDTVTAADSSESVHRTVEVSAIGGYQWFDKAAALRNAPAAGLRIVNPRILGLAGLSLGFTAGVSRPTTRGDYFPWNREIFFSDINRRNDTTLVFEVSQRVTVANYGAELGWRVGGGGAGAIPGLSAATLDLSAGAGGYAIWMDPEQNRGNKVHARPALSFGAGVGVPLRGATSIRVRLDDLVFLRYNRQWLSLHDPLFAEELFPNPTTTPPAAKSTVHNLRLSMQFSFFPGTGQ